MVKQKYGETKIGWKKKDETKIGWKKNRMKQK
jgi:hypothetical protein